MSRKLRKIYLIWRLVFCGKRERFFCAVCNNVSYNWKDFGVHKKHMHLENMIEQYVDQL
jgi:hypothetical protein